VDRDGNQHYESKLNYQMFRLEGERLRKTEGAQELSELFPPGKEKEWPTLVLISKPAIVSPQVFFDCFTSAQAILPRVTDIDNDHAVYAGSYYGRGHLHANIVDSIKRYRKLGSNPEDLSTMTPGGELQAYQLLDILLARDEEGNVILEDKKPVLRPDAKNVLKHIIGYGYSAGHMANKDAFRVLRDMLGDGDVMIVTGQNEEGILQVRESCAADADKLLPNARLVGVAGMDRMDIPNPGMPREVDFLSPEEFTTATLGPRLIGAPNVIKLTMRDDEGKAITDDVGGHAQSSYVRAILSSANEKQCADARSKLASGLAR